MSLERDQQSFTAYLKEDDLTVDIRQPITDYSQIVDTQGFRTFTVTVEPDSLPFNDVANRIIFIAQDSPDGITWSDVSQTKIIPHRHYATAGQFLCNPIIPYIQSFGIISVERYVKVGLTAIAGCVGAYLHISMEAELKDFIGYDPNIVLDGLA